MIESVPAGIDRRLVALYRPASWETERYRALRRSLERSYPLERRRVIAVTSANAEEGKSTTAVNLAAVFAEIPDASVVLIDADFRRSSLARLLAIPTDESEDRDLGDAIDDPTLSLAAVTQPRSELVRFGVVPTRPRPDSAHLLVESPRFASLLIEARKAYQFVVLDTPPLLPVSDCRAIGQWVDGFVLVVAAHRTSRERLGEALSLIEPRKLLGLVFNGDDEPAWRGSSHYYADYRRAP